jgi:HSP20 family protein
MVPVLQSNGSLAHTSQAPVNRLSTLFDRIFNDDIFALLATPQALYAVPLSMWEDEHNFYVEVDAPGMTEKDIDVSVQNGDLVIRGERKCEEKGNGYDSRSYGRFEQRISLPAWAKADTVQAKLANGVLSLTFPKGEEAKPRRIALKAE